jgi:hypothetical protein
MDAALFHGAPRTRSTTTTPITLRTRTRVLCFRSARSPWPTSTCLGRKLVTAYIAGFQVFGKLGRVLNFATTSEDGTRPEPSGALGLSHSRAAAPLRCRSANGAGDRGVFGSGLRVNSAAWSTAARWTRRA